MQKQELIKIGTEMFGGSRWGGKLAEVAGVSPATISQALNGAPISKKTAARILDAYNAYSDNAPVSQKVVKMVAPQIAETDEQIASRINKRFSIMNRMVQGVIAGDIRSMIVYGAPGIGKTFDIEKALKKASHTGLHYDMIKGSASAPGLYQALYNARKGGVVVIDDCDSIFDDEDALNILKGALDSTDERVISWRKNSSWVYDVNSQSDDEEEEGGRKSKRERLPNMFEFEGAVIFITNLDFEAKISGGSRMAPHFEALMSRSLYLNLTLSTTRDKIIRIKQIFVNAGMYRSCGVNEVEAAEIMDFVMDHAEDFNELSLRLMKHVTQIFQLGGDWKDVLKITKMKG